LRRHILLKHSKEEEVKQASNLSKGDLDQFFEQIRKAGILKYNKEEMRKEKPMYERKRAPSRAASVSSTEEIVICGKCNGTYAIQFFGRHKKLCIGESAYVPKALPINLLKDSINEVSRP